MMTRLVVFLHVCALAWEAGIYSLRSEWDEVQRDPATSSLQVHLWSHGPKAGVEARAVIAKQSEGMARHGPTNRWPILSLL